MLDTLLHKRLRLPYRLHIHEYRRVKGSKKTLVFLHGIGSSGSMWQALTSQDFDAKCIVIDLLGFGQSPKPKWARYDATMQAKAVAHTLALSGNFGPVIVVGHSMGALVGVELAKKYRPFIEKLILCSPPFYKEDATTGRLALPTSETVLRRLYESVHSNPKQFAKLTTFATKYKLVNDGFNVTNDNIDTYSAALDAMILNQTAFEDALRLKVPTQIIRGTFDPVVIGKNLKQLQQQNSKITVTSVPAGHEIRGALLKELTDTINAELTRSN